jgi:hypothetical protein
MARLRGNPSTSGGLVGHGRLPSSWAGDRRVAGGGPLAPQAIYDASSRYLERPDVSRGRHVLVDRGRWQPVPPMPEEHGEPGWNGHEEVQFRGSDFAGEVAEFLRGGGRGRAISHRQVARTTRWREHDGPSDTNLPGMPQGLVARIGGDRKH